MDKSQKAGAAPAGSAELLKQLESAKDAFGAGKAEREAARAARAKAKGVEPVNAEEAKAMRKRMAEKAKAMTKILVPLAGIGAKDAIEKAFEQGASSKACDKGLTPSLAAIGGGHIDLARWLISRKDHAWVDTMHSRNNYTELSAAINADELELAKDLVAMRPSLAMTSKGSKQWDASLFDLALGQSPRCAAWLIQTGIGPKMPKGRGHYNPSRVRALAKSLRDGDMSTAQVIFDFLLPELYCNGAGALLPESMGYQLIDTILHRDDAEGLAWVLSRAPDLVRAASEGVMGAAGSSRGYWLNYDDKANQALILRMKSLHDESNRAKALRSTLPAYAACSGAFDCLSLLLKVDFFRQQLGQMQTQPDKYGWEPVLFTVNDPAIVEAMQGAGFNFEKRMADGWNYLGALMGENKATVRILEFIGRKMPSLMDPIQAGEGIPPVLVGKTCFEQASALRYPNRNITKWHSVCEKASIRSGSARARQTKDVKEKSKPRRL